MASWAVKNGLEKYAYYGNGGSFECTESEHFDSASNVTAEFVNGMNNAIDTYNSNNEIEVKCEYKWNWASGSWPVLVSSGNN